MDCGYVEITPATQPLIESSYEARSNKELPVLVQYIDRRKVVVPKATHLDVILYSREQINEENRAMGTVVRTSVIICQLSDQLPLTVFYAVVLNVATRLDRSMGHHQRERSVWRPRTANAADHHHAERTRYSSTYCTTSHALVFPIQTHTPSS